MKDDYQDILKNLSAALLLFSNKYLSAINEATKALSQKVIPLLQSLYEEIPTITEERKLELEAFCEKLLDYGWIICDFVPIDIFKEDFTSQESADNYFFGYCKENLESIFDSLRNSSIQKEDIDNIKQCCEMGAYKACCGLILSNIEHYILLEYNVTENTILKSSAIEKIKEKNKEIADNKVAIFLYLHNYSLYLGLREVFMDKGNFRVVDDSNFIIPNRHQLMHGYSKRTYTKKDCLFLLLLLYGFIEQKDYFIKDT